MGAFDTHFKLYLPSEDDIEIDNAIKFYKIGQHVEVVAVFDTTMSRQVHCGDKLLKINNYPVRDYIRKNMQKVVGSSAGTREGKVIQRMLSLTGASRDSVLTLSFVNVRGDTFSLKLKLNPKKRVVIL